jgi:hypothetical protein
VRAMTGVSFDFTKSFAIFPAKPVFSLFVI